MIIDKPFTVSVAGNPESGARSMAKRILEDVRLQFIQEASAVSQAIPKRSGALRADFEASASNSTVMDTTATLVISSSLGYSEDVNKRTGFFDKAKVELGGAVDGMVKVAIGRNKA